MKLLTILILFAVTGLTFNAHAQKGSSADQKVRFGMKRGLNMSTIYAQENGDFHTEVKVGLVMGAFVNIPLTSSLAFQPEVLYSSKGFRGEWPWLGKTYEFTRTTIYIDVPLLMAYKAGHNVSLLIGPHISYLISQKDQVKGNDFSVAHYQTFNSVTPRRNAVGITGGADFYVRAIVLGARASCDFTRNNFDSGDGSPSMPSYKNVWLQASVGFIL